MKRTTTSEADIQELLSVESGSEKVSALVPKMLLDRIIAAYRKKVGAVREHGLKSQALFYFAARGLTDWEIASTVQSELQKLVDEGLAEEVGGKYRLTKKGRRQTRRIHGYI